MGMKMRTSIVAALLLLGAATPQPTGAQFPSTGDFDPTGTWEGDVSCRTQVDGTPQKADLHDQIIKISPGGGGFFLILTGRESLVFDFRYRGSFTPDAKKPSEKGAGTFVECRTSTEIPGRYNEVLSVNFKGKAEEARLEGTSAYNEPPLRLQGGVCRLSFKRISTEDPGVSDPCPPTP